MTNTIISRRGLVAGMGALGGLSLLPAFAQSDDDYKALVCVIFHGGLDSFECIIPTDEQGYRAWERHRKLIVDQYRSKETVSRERDSLLPFTDGPNGAFGFAAELAPLAALYKSGQLAVVPNAGPLEEPTTRSLMSAGKVRLPRRLASHNDQRSIWMSMMPEGAATGWGGRLLDAIAEDSPFSSISFNGTEVFAAGERTLPVTLRGSRGRAAFGVDSDKVFGSESLPDILTDHYLGQDVKHGSVLRRDVAAAQARGVSAILRLTQAQRGSDISDQVRVPNNKLSDQLGAVADVIASRDALGAKRQVFVVGMGGFDTHRRQAYTLPALQSQVALALARFQTAMNGLGIAESVTAFTVSDFGRTLSANSSGTDHGWGGHHYVMGGAVKGGRVTQDIPPLSLDHDQALWQRGALVPEVSIEQYGAALGSWFGVAESDLRSIFPHLGRFDRDAVQLF
ncbi:MAG: DUF1501 domain-containing protein [Pseudomonadota bacterium]